ncbi:hypothetical protein RvY_01568 [Ramazzottius varieornatus]|uniref:Uncharacterized protein n=1 Tax=Ramazzottius varieornatus TaxID=947166 RepID=A0A1D1UMT8_RAMVA|nr:hypothetical protein RvY_01568 [Ramazzottius varieornatus]
MREGNYVTMLDPFHKKFGARMGGLLFIPAVLGELFWSAAILSALGATITVIVGLDDISSIVVSACIAIVYTMFGGLYSVAYTDVVQLICIFVGLWICVPFALTNEKVADISSTSPRWLGELDVSAVGVYIDNYLVLLLGGIPWQALFQRILSSKSTETAMKVTYVSAMGCAIMCVPSILIGAVATSADWTNTTFGRMPGVNGSDYEARLVLPLVLQNFTPSAVAFIGLGAVSAAVMSSADSSVLSASSMFSWNIYKMLCREKASDREILWVMKGAVVAMGFLAAGLAILVPSVYGLYFLCSDLVYCILFPQLVLVLYFKDVNTYGSLAGYLVALVLRLLAGEPTFGIPAAVGYFYVADDGSQLFPFRTFAMLVNLLTTVSVSLLAKYLFVQRELLPMAWDVFRCFVPTDEPELRPHNPLFLQKVAESHTSDGQCSPGRTSLDKVSDIKFGGKGVKHEDLGLTDGKGTFNYGFSQL